MDTRRVAITAVLCAAGLLGGCAVYSEYPAYTTYPAVPAPVVVAPAPVYAAPPPVYYVPSISLGIHGRSGHRHHRHHHGHHHRHRH